VGAPGRSIKRIGEVLSLMRHFSVTELHYADGKGTFVTVVDYVLANPKVAFPTDSPNGESRRLPRMMTPERLQILATANYLAGLRILADNVIVINFVFSHLVARRRSGPVSIDRRPNFLLVTCHLSLVTSSYCLDATPIYFLLTLGFYFRGE